MSCGSRTSCFAVGGGDTGSLVEHWNGRGWSIVHVPTGRSDVEFDTVSCSSASNCLAIGQTNIETATTFTAEMLADHWNGRQWKIVASPLPVASGSVQLTALACVNAKSCFAAGSIFTGSFTDLESDDFGVTEVVEHWNGSTWTVMKLPNPKGAEISLLSGISCTGPKSCFAVGGYAGNTSGGALAEHWNGARWSVVKTPQPAFPFAKGKRARLVPRDTVIVTIGVDILGELSVVSCASAQSCFAVGEGFNGPLIERWNGKKWSIVTNPAPPAGSGSQLESVSCATPTDCSAVGESFSTSISDPISEDFESTALAEHWNGTAWSIVPQPHGAQFTELTSVSCPKANSCAAVGDSSFVQHWNGDHWSIAPFTSKTSQSQLNNVACATTTNCFAVGADSTGSTTQALIEQRTPAGWKIVASPHPSGALETVLYGVTCASTTDCTAVGTSADDTAQNALVEHWNGTAWSIVPSPVSAGAETQLLSVVCPSVTDCNAVGTSFSDSSPFGGASTFAEHWDGSTWSVVASPNPPFGAFDELTGISCASTTDCMASGYYEAETGTRADHRAHLDGALERYDVVGGAVTQRRRRNLQPRCSTCRAGPPTTARPWATAKSPREVARGRSPNIGTGALGRVSASRALRARCPPVSTASRAGACPTALPSARTRRFTAPRRWSNTGTARIGSTSRAPIRVTTRA